MRSAFRLVFVVTLALAAVGLDPQRASAQAAPRKAARAAAKKAVGAARLASSSPPD